MPGRSDITLDSAELKSGRQWTADVNGISSVTRSYRIVRSSESANESATYTSLPTIGSTLTADSPLTAQKITFREREDSGRKIVDADVEFALPGAASETASENVYAVEQWGWQSGSVARDFVTDLATSKTIKNSAGDAFDGTIQVDYPAPVFTKVVKAKNRQSGWVGYYGKLNNAAVTIGGVTCAIKTLRVTNAAEERLFNDPDGFKYRYTISMQYYRNPQSIAKQAVADIGWDVAVTDAGVRELDENSKRVRITQVDETTGKTAYVTQPVLLDGNGHKVVDTDPDPTPYNFRFQCYETAAIPAMFYSEPA